MIKISKYCADLFLLCVLVCLLAAQPATARGSTINQIEPSDVIFIYEENLDLTALRANVSLPVTKLVHYVDDNPEMPQINSISVQDDTAFSVMDVGNDYGTYYAWSSLGGAGPAIRISEPEIAIEAVLAAPNHSDRISSGTTIPTGTEIAFRVTSRDVGKYYVTNGNGQAEISIGMTTPSGASQIVIVQRISGSEFYTDDSWVAGSLELDDGEGTYTFQAYWTSPDCFADYASDSNVISVRGIKEVEEEATPTDTFTWPVHTDTPETYETPTSTITWPVPPTNTPHKPTVVTAAPTPVPTTIITCKTPNIPTVVRTEATTTPKPGDLIPSFGSLAVATTEPTPTPVPEPAGLIPVFGGLAAALLLVRRG